MVLFHRLGLNSLHKDGAFSQVAPPGVSVDLGASPSQDQLLVAQKSRYAHGTTIPGKKTANINFEPM